MSNEVSEAVIIVIAGTFLMLILVIFIISFFFIHQRRQTEHKLEKAALKAQYETEILNAENEIQEATMKHISRELHDNVSQMLTLARIQLNGLKTTFLKKNWKARQNMWPAPCMIFASYPKASMKTIYLPKA